MERRRSASAAEGAGPSLMVHTAGVTVLGAGLTGAATALELASHGVEVTLVERDERPGNRASLRNEGRFISGCSMRTTDRSRRPHSS